MSTEKAEVKVFITKLFCDKCKGEMLPTGVTLLSNPPQYMHKCGGCGHMETHRGAYPMQSFQTPKPMIKGLVDSMDGENVAVRGFLIAYGSMAIRTIEGMRGHLVLYGMPYWPTWVEDGKGHLTKGGAQSWLRHLFDLEKQYE